ncbi:MAG: zinc-ribbon domain-containing protein [Sandaracinaceae bacterium]
MSAGIRDCTSCGHPNTGDAMFCSKCGARLPKFAASSPEEREQKAGAAFETVVDVPGASDAEPSKPESSKPEAAGAGSSGAGSSDANSSTEASSVVSSGEVAGQGTRRPGVARTMLGMPSPEQAEAMKEARKRMAEAKAEKAKKKAAEAENDPPSKPERRIAGSARTMLGMPAPDRDKVDEAVAEAKRKRAEKKDAAADEAVPDGVSRARPRKDTAPENALDPNTNRTMLGQPAPVAPKKEPPPSSESKTEGRPRGEQESQRGRAEVLYPTNTDENDALSLPQRRAPKGVAIAVLVAGVLILLAGVGALIYSLAGGGPDVQASVVQGEDGEVLSLTVAGAEDGARVRFSGTELPLEAGTARFPLSANDLSLGENVLSVDVIHADGSVETATVALNLGSRVRADVGPLQASPPAIDIVVEAPAGSEVTLDGEALALDGQGRGTRRFVIDGGEANAEGVVEHVVRYRVQPPEGETAQGELRTRVPLTTLTLDRPGENVVTEAESIEVAGAVGPETAVTVAGAEVEVNEGRFLHRVPLEMGEQTVEVVARAPGKAPRHLSIALRRVEDLAAEAATFEPDASLTYARIAQSPDTYRTQRVALEGVVYNVNVTRGQSVLQILVDDCPSGERCPIWVTYSQATEAELSDRVRVLGTVAGQQQFRSQSGAVRTVPRVDATYVLPAPAGRRR